MLSNPSALAWCRRGTLWGKIILPAFFTVAAFADTGSVTTENLDSLRSEKALFEYAQQQFQRQNPYPYHVLSASTNLSDSVIDMLQSGDYQPLVGQRDKVNRLVDILTRSAGKVPVVVGEVGVGKSAILTHLVKQILEDDMPSDLHKRELTKSVVLQMSARTFMPGGMDLNAAMPALMAMGNAVGRPIVLVLNDLQFMNPYNYSVIRDYASKANHIPVILESNLKDHVTSVVSDQNLQRYLDFILIEKPKVEEIRAIIKAGHSDRIWAVSDVKITDEIIDAVIDSAGDYRMDLGEPARSLQLLEDFAINFRRNDGAGEPNRKDVFKFVARKLQLPVIPQNAEEFNKYMDQLRAELKSEVISQDHLVDGLVDQFVVALTSKSKKHQSAVITGSTGVGKTLVAERLAARFFGSTDRVLTIDMTEFTNAQSARNALFGATNGFVSADTNKGVVCEYLDGAGMNGGVIILNELEEAPGEVQTLLMELLDRGEVRGGDGRIRRLNRHLIIATSNKRSGSILPADRLKGMTSKELDRFVKSVSEEQLKKTWTEKESFMQSDSKVVKTAVPERIDRFYFARPLLLEDAVRVGNLEVAKWVKEFAALGKGEVQVAKDFSASLIPAFYDQTLGARQIRNQASKYLNKAVEEYFAKHPEAKGKKLLVSAAVHPTQKTTSYIKVKAEGASDELTLDGPKIPVTNQLLDPEVRQKLKTLNETLEKEIFGQPEAVEAVVSAVKARYLNPDNPKATNGVLIGTTGTGKTQIAKALAKALFGRPDAFALFEMGKVKDETSLGTIFSPSPPFIGSDQPGQFEKFLQAFPDGGVGIFDEFSNVGGNSLEKKASILKEFYTILDEGFYYSPATKKRYDLRKYVFLFTGNDGEQALKGGQSDEMLMDQWRSVTEKKGGAQEILEKAGVPAAFLGRNWFIVFMRPAVKETKLKIAEKLLNEWKREVTTAQPIEIEFTPKFIEEVALLTFSPDRGARSINDFINGPLAKSVGEEIIKHLDWDKLLEKGGKAQIKLDVRVKKPLLPFFLGEKPDETEAKILMDLEQEGKVLSKIEVDFVKMASFMQQVHVDSAWATAIHEMGHAVTAYPGVTGKKVKKVTIVPEKIPGGLSAAGYTNFEEVPTKGKMDWNWLIHHIAGLLAGSEAELLYGEERNVGRSNDVTRAGELARKVILDHHLIAGLDTTKAYMDGNGKLLENLPQKEKALIEASVAKAMDEGRKLAIKQLKADWHIVIAGSKLLLEKGSIDGKEFEQLVQSGREAEAKASGATNLLVALKLKNAADAYPISLNKYDGNLSNPVSEKPALPEYETKKKRPFCETLLLRRINR